MALLTDARIEHILGSLPQRTIGVLGDLFLDRYLDIDARLTERSIETNLDAYQVTRVRSLPGALGTIINNLVALGVGRVVPISIIGDDGEGYELRQSLDEMGVVDTNKVDLWDKKTFRTPTYVKPMLHHADQVPRELNRLDIKNRTPLRPAAEDLILTSIVEVWPTIDALIVLDQVSEANCGVVTDRVREKLTDLGNAQPNKFLLADSRERIGLFRACSVKPNIDECTSVFGALEPLAVDVAATKLAQQTNRPVFCTRGESGILLAFPAKSPKDWQTIPGYPVAGPIDIVGAGDSTSAGITCAVAAGASLEEAAAFGCLVASITVQQLGTTGTASPAQVRQRWREVNGR